MAIAVANPTAPHKIVLYLRAEVREVMPTGELHGNLTHSHPAVQNGRFEIFAHDAQDRDVAIRVLNEFIDTLRSKGFVAAITP